MYRVWRLVILGVAIASALVAVPAAAQEGTPTPGVGQNVTTRTVPIVGADDYLWFTALVLVFAAAALLGFLFYVYKIQKHFYATTTSLVRLGHVPSISSVPTLPAARGASELPIEGPAVVEVGEASGEFVARLDGNLATDAKWKIDPPGMAAWTAVGTDGSARITVTAARPGVFTLTASSADKTSPPLQVVAIAPSGERVNLPFIGQDFGTVLIALVLVAAVILLAIGGILGAEAVATFFGGLLGYIFGVSRRGQSSGSNDGSDGS